MNQEDINEAFKGASQKNFRCFVCKNDGFVTAVRKGKDKASAPYAFRCANCKKADEKRISRMFPVWRNQPDFEKT